MGQPCDDDYFEEPPRKASRRNAADSSNDETSAGNEDDLNADDASRDRLREQSTIQSIPVRPHIRCHKCKKEAMPWESSLYTSEQFNKLATGEDALTYEVLDRYARDNYLALAARRTTRKRTKSDIKTALPPLESMTELLRAPVEIMMGGKGDMRGKGASFRSRSEAEVECVSCLAKVRDVSATQIRAHHKSALHVPSL